MKRVFAFIMAAVMLTVMAVAADFNPGTKIRFNGNEDRWEGDLKAINTDNYSVSSVKWEQGRDLVSSVTIDNDDEVLVVALKHDYKSTKEKTLEGTIKLREKGKSRYATLSINCTIGYEVMELTIDANGDVDVPTIDSGTLYRIEDEGQGYGTLSFSAGDTDISVRVYDDEVYYLAHNNDAIKSVLTANNDSDATIDFLTFPGTPTFNATATVNFYGVEEDQFIYELKNGRLNRSAAKWSEENGSWELKTRTLGSYVISDKALRSPTGTSSGSSGSSGGSVNNDTGTNNPSTGANDVTGVATALALISLASAAAISLKKD
ncbi:MAG: hypothetical protein HFF15_08585 [Angelakisella sp.]|jgi:hypothetical protein|nr:hypothetical protein [Angelakisella sp.]